MEDAVLIEQVQKFPFLYDRSHRNFKNKQKRRNAWETIAAVCEDSVDNVEKRWGILQNRYASEKRKIRCVPSGSGATATPVWRYFDCMQFLDQHVKCRKTSGNYSRPNDSQETDNDMPSDIWDSINSITTDQPEILSDDEVSSNAPTPVDTVAKAQVHTTANNSQVASTSTGTVTKGKVLQKTNVQSSSSSGSTVQTPMRKKNRGYSRGNSEII